MKNINTIFKIFLFTTVFSLSSCETFDLDQTTDPSGLPADKLDPVYAFNYAQTQLPDFVYSSNSFTQRVTRQMAMTGGTTYDNAYSPELFDTNWIQAYMILNTIKGAEQRALDNKQYQIYGASKVIRCYILMSLVDMYGDIPYSEALQGNGNLTPRYDNSEAVYEGVYEELNVAIEYLTKTDNTTIPDLQPYDLYYGNTLDGAMNPGKWVTLSKTLKFKMLNNARLVGSIGSINVASEMAALIAGNDLIDSIDEDFAFKYGTNLTNPNSRHPLYNNHYDSPSPSYISNYMFWTVTREKISGTNLVVDPRANFYFYKQDGDLSDMSSQELPCKVLTKPPHYSEPQYASFYEPSILAPYCTSIGVSAAALQAAYLGRDHGDRSGIPQDDNFRTLAGIYPAGGAIGAPKVVNYESGALGAGIMPMVLSSYVHFIKAEAILTLGLPGDARVELEAAIRASILKSTTLITPALPGGNPPSAASVTAYVDYVLSFYDTLNNDRKLELIEKEYFIASWGNGIEPYNNYRRTGYPSNFQPTLEELSGSYYSTALYAAIAANNNPNTPDNVRTRKVFWDVANITLH